MARWRARHRGSRPERGAAAVEFAIVLTVLLLILFGLIDFGRLLFVSQAMKSASREGARTAIIATNDAQQINAAISNAAEGGVALSGTGGPTDNYYAMDWTPPAVVGDDLPTIGLTPCATQASADSITIRVSVGFDWFTPAFLFAPTVDSVDASTTMRCE